MFLSSLFSCVKRCCCSLKLLENILFLFKGLKFQKHKIPIAQRPRELTSKKVVSYDLVGHAKRK